VINIYLTYKTVKLPLYFITMPWRLGMEDPQLTTKWRQAKSSVPYWSCNPG